MKFMFSLFIYLAVTAISADIVLKLVDSSTVIAVEEETEEPSFSSVIDDPLEEDPIDEEEEEERKEKELFWISFGESAFALPKLDQTAVNIYAELFIEHPHQSPPFSPPESV